MRQALIPLGLLLVLSCVGCGEPEVASPGRYYASGEYSAPVRMRERAPNLIVLVIDSLRADAIPGRMANLTALAQKGAWFSQATASAPWTLPSMTSLLTGRLPSQHGLLRMHPGARLLPDVTTFAEVLHKTGGYDTAAFVSGPWLNSDRTSVLQGFQTVAHGFTLQSFDAKFDRWHRFRDRSRPFFLLLHSFDAHMPYGKANHPFPHREPAGGKLTREQALALTPRDVHRTFALDYDAVADLRKHRGEKCVATSAEYSYQGWRDHPDDELADELRRAYWGGVAWTDELVDLALGRLRRWGLLENTVVVITSDHGETFGEHGTLGHGLQLHDELIRVPLVVMGPAPFDRPRAVHDPVALLDVLPTFLDLIGLPPLSGGVGLSMLPVLEGGTRAEAVFSEEWLDHENTGTSTHTALVSARTPSWKYMAHFDRDTGAIGERAYDLVLDPEELDDLARGFGLAEGVPFDDPTCRAVERIRDLLWGAVGEEKQADEGLSVPYASGRSTPSVRRPRLCGTTID